MQDAMRTVVMIAGVLLLVVAAVLFGQAISGASDMSSLVSMTLGFVGLGIFLIGLCVPKGVLQKPGGDLQVDATNLGSVDDHQPRSPAVFVWIVCS